MRNIIFSLILIQGIFCGSLGWGWGWDYTSDVNKARAQYNDPSTSDKDRESIAEAYPEIANPSSHSSGGGTSDGAKDAQEATTSPDLDKDPFGFTVVPNAPTSAERDVQTKVDAMDQAALDNLDAKLSNFYKNEAASASPERSLAAAKLEGMVRAARERLNAAAAGNETAETKKGDEKSAGAEPQNERMKPVEGHFAVSKDGKRYPMYDVDGKRISAAPNDPGAVIVEDLKTGKIGFYDPGQLGFKINSDGTLERTHAPTLAQNFQVAPAVFPNGGSKFEPAYSQKDGTIYYGSGNYLKSYSPGAVVQSVDPSRSPTFTTTPTGGATPGKIGPSNLGSISWPESSNSSKSGGSRAPAAARSSGTTPTSSGSTAPPRRQSSTPTGGYWKPQCAGGSCSMIWVPENGTVSSSF